MGMRSKYSTSLTLLAAIVLVTGCSSSGGSPSAAASVAASAAAPSVAASAAATSAAPSASTEASASASSSAAAGASASASSAAASGGPAVKATPGQSVKMMLLPKFLGILPFDQANKGATEAATELKNPEKLSFVGPTPENSVAGQIEFMTNAPTQGMKVVMMSNNAGDQIAPAAEKAQTAGTKVVTWDSPIPSAKGETVFVAQVDFNSIGVVMADMALNIMGPDGGNFAVLSASPDAAN